jgi:transcriptional regulator with XRE-family HTH domain
MLVQKLRLQRGWSQQQLAEFSGLSVRTIQRIERGQPANIETLKSLASVFQIDFNQLSSEFDMNDDTPPSDHMAADRKREAEERLAFKHVRRLKAFYLELWIYVVIISLLLLVNLTTTPRVLWFVWPALGWGLSLIVRVPYMFNNQWFLGPQWEKRQVEKRLGRKL